MYHLRITKLYAKGEERIVLFNKKDKYGLEFGMRYAERMAEMFVTSENSYWDNNEMIVGDYKISLIPIDKPKNVW